MVQGKILKIGDFMLTNPNISVILNMKYGS